MHLSMWKVLGTQIGHGCRATLAVQALRTGLPACAIDKANKRVTVYVKEPESFVLWEVFAFSATFRS